MLHHSATADGQLRRRSTGAPQALGWDGCGYHFVIGNGTGSPDGQIEVAQRWSNQKHGVHCRNGKNPDVNEYGIGICLVGDLDETPPTPRQIAAAQALVAYLEPATRSPPITSAPTPSSPAARPPAPASTSPPGPSSVRPRIWC